MFFEKKGWPNIYSKSQRFPSKFNICVIMHDLFLKAFSLST
jgi:hypothetical protein